RDRGSYLVPIHEFLRAIIYGDNIYYAPERSPIGNLIDISSNDPKEHFLLPGLLQATTSLADTATNSGFIRTKRIYDALQQYGFTPRQIDFTLERAFEKKLILSSNIDKTNSEEDLPDAIRITTVGAYHIQRLIQMFS